MDLFGMMGKVKEAQEKMKVAQDKAGFLRAEGESGAGMVKVTVSGNRKVVKIDIDQSIMDDKEMVQDLVVAATNIALANIEIEIKASLAQSMDGVLPNIPGLDFNQFLK